MITVYSTTAASKITGRIVKKLEVWANCIYVTFENGQTRFISKKVFWELFHQSRKQRAQNLYISHYGKSLFQVEGFNRDFYFVELDKDRVICECEDYKNQKEYQKESSPICKHGWRTLNYVGFDSLSDYIRSNKYYSLQEN
jgi:hypothetical protein